MEPKDLLKRVGDTLSQRAGEKQAEKQQLEKERRDLITSIGKDIADALTPYLKTVVERSQITKEDLKAALSEVQINVPEANVNIPEIRVPEAKVTVSVPDIKIPQINVPQTNIQYPDMMRVNLDGVDKLQPLPVIMMDTKGNPFQMSSNGGGGKADFLTIKDIRASSVSIIDQDTGAMKVSGSFSVTASNSSTHIIDASNEIVGSVANPLNVAVVSGAGSSTFAQIGNSDGTFYNSDNPLPVTFSAASVQPVSQVSGASWSVTVNSISGSTATSLLNGDGNSLDPRDRNWTITESLNVNQVSGASWSTAVVSVSDIFSTTATSTVVNPDNRVRVELPATTITGITNTVAAMNVDSTGVGYSGSNPLPIYSANTLDVKQLSGAIDSVFVTGITGTIATVGDIASDVADTESNPVKTGGVARTANPTAVANGDRVSSTFDDLGRQIMRPLQVRDLILTAYTSITNGTETTLRSAVAGAYLDLVLLTLGNTSDAAVAVDVRAVTAGNVVTTIVVPPYGTAGYSSNIPYAQADTGNSWTIDMPDITGTTVYATALFSQEV